MKSKNWLKLVLAVVVVGTLSSCNKGVGCPYEMNISDFISILPF